MAQIIWAQLPLSKVPGRKTDVKDAEWIADLLCHGLLRASFVPPKLIRELRDLTRYRRKLVESQAAERNRLLKLLETANIKPDFAVDRLRASGRHASHLISYISASESNRFSKSTRLRGTRWCVRRFSSLAATASPRPRDAHRHQEDKNRGPGKQVHPEANGDAAPRGRQAISEGEEGACDVVSCFCSLFRSQGRRRRRKANCMRTSR